MWCGLLKSLLDSDLHIIRDDVKSSKNSRYNRNKIQGDSSDIIWLTIPFVGFKDHKLIKDQELNTSKSTSKKIINIFSSRYSKYPFFETSLSVLQDTLDHSSDKTPLVKVYTSFLYSLKSIGLPICDFRCASDLGLCNEFESMHGIEKLNTILDCAHATSYLAAENTVNYAKPLDYSTKTVLLQKFNPSPYLQIQNRVPKEQICFTPFLSTLDIIASLPIDEVINNLSHSNEWNKYK